MIITTKAPITAANKRTPNAVPITSDNATGLAEPITIRVYACSRTHMHHLYYVHDAVGTCAYMI